MGASPKALKRYRMILIHKFEGAAHPKDFRPISMGSIIRRLLTGILNRRIARVVTDEGFKAGIEGCGVNIRILSDALKRTARSERDLSIAWIDLRKAFDSINHLKLIEVLIEGDEGSLGK